MVKQNVSIKLCGPILSLIERIKEGKFIFRVKDRLHAKLYIGKNAAELDSANFYIQLHTMLSDIQVQKRELVTLPSVWKE